MLKDALSYYIKAFIALAILTIIGVNAALLPILLIPFVLLFYAILPTIGLTYTISVKRIYRQFRYTPNGKLGSFNRKWLFKFGLLFFVSLFSALVFLVNAPSWDLTNWVFIWIAAIVYYPLFQVVKIYLNKELMPRFIKASSIRAGFVIVVTFACILYAIYAALTPTESPDKLSEAINNRELFFQGSSIVLLADLDKLTTFFDSVSSFALASTATSFFIVGLVFRLIAFASMLYGFVGILGFCMLSPKEVKSVFQLLPAFDKSEKLNENQPVLIRYFILIVALWLVVIGVLGYAEFKTEETLETTGTTPISDFVDNQMDVVVQTIEWAEGMNALIDEFTENKNKLVSRYENKLNNLLAEYYDSCESDIDSYLDWYYGLAGQVTNALKFIPLARDRALDEFNSKVAEGDSTSSVRSKFKHQYDNYQAQMNQIIDDFNEKAKKLSSEQLPIPSIPSITFSIKDLINANKTLSLWPTLNSGNDNDKKDIASKILPSDSSDREAFKQKLVELIAEEKQKSLETLKAQFDITPIAS